MGCVIAELVINKSMFTGKTATDHLFQIIKVLGILEENKAMINFYHNKFILMIFFYVLFPFFLIIFYSLYIISIIYIIL